VKFNIFNIFGFGGCLLCNIQIYAQKNRQNLDLVRLKE